MFLNHKTLHKLLNENKNLRLTKSFKTSLKFSYQSRNNIFQNRKKCSVKLKITVFWLKIKCNYFLLIAKKSTKRYIFDVLLRKELNFCCKRSFSPEKFFALIIERNSQKSNRIVNFYNIKFLTLETSFRWK